jgi:tetratricopeptide (TPR) repeat protein
MRPRLYPIVIAVVLAGTGIAVGETELVVVGPAADGKLAGAPARHVTGALAEAQIALAPRKVEVRCASDVACLATLGTEVGAKKIVAITVTKDRGKKLSVLLVAVDVADKVLLARRELTFVERKLDRELGPAVKKFIDDAPVERAKALFATGNQHYNLGEFAPALEQYKLAYKTKPLAAFLFNIGQCHRKLGQYADAVTMYQSYLNGVPNAQNRTLVESLIRESRDKLAALEKKAADQAAEAARLEAQRLATEKAKAEEARKAKEAEALAAAERRKAEQTRLEGDKARRAAQDKLYDQHPARTWVYVGTAVGAAAVGAGGYFGFRARSAQEAYDDRGCGNPGTLLDADELAACRSDRDTGKQSATLGNVLLVGGGALVAISAVVFIIDPGNVERPRDSRAQLLVSPTSLDVVVRW